MFTIFYRLDRLTCFMNSLHLFFGGLLNLPLCYGLLFITEGCNGTFNLVAGSQTILPYSYFYIDNIVHIASIEKNVLDSIYMVYIHLYMYTVLLLFNSYLPFLSTHMDQSIQCTFRLYLTNNS